MPKAPETPFPPAPPSHPWHSDFLAHGLFSTGPEARGEAKKCPWRGNWNSGGYISLRRRCELGAGGGATQAENFEPSALVSALTGGGVRRPPQGVPPPCQGVESYWSLPDFLALGMWGAPFRKTLPNPARRGGSFCSVRFGGFRVGGCRVRGGRRMWSSVWLLRARRVALVQWSDCPSLPFSAHPCGLRWC